MNGCRTRPRWTGRRAARRLVFTPRPHSSAGLSGISQLTWFDRSGKPLGTLGAARTIQKPAISPDGTKVAIDLMDTESSGMNIWQYDLKRAGAVSRLTFGRSNMLPVWLRDGSSIAFASGRDGGMHVYRRATAGAPQDELLDKNGVSRFPVDWSPDGNFLVENDIDPKTGYDIWVLPMSGDRKPYPYLNTEANEVGGELSPDGRWLAYGSDETKRNDVYVQSFPRPGAGAKQQVSTNGGAHPVWSRDGRELYYIGADQKMMAVDVKNGTTLQFGVPKPLFPVRLGNVNARYDVSQDGRFLIPVAVEPDTSPPITVEINWAEQIRR